MSPPPENQVGGDTLDPTADIKQILTKLSMDYAGVATALQKMPSVNNTLAEVKNQMSEVASRIDEHLEKLNECMSTVGATNSAVARSAPVVAPVADAPASQRRLVLIESSLSAMSGAIAELERMAKAAQADTTQPKWRKHLPAAGFFTLALILTGVTIWAAVRLKTSADDLSKTGDEFANGMKAPLEALGTQENPGTVADLKSKTEKLENYLGRLDASLAAQNRLIETFSAFPAQLTAAVNGLKPSLVSEPIEQVRIEIEKHAKQELTDAAALQQNNRDLRRRLEGAYSQIGGGVVRVIVAETVYRDAAFIFKALGHVEQEFRRRNVPLTVGSSEGKGSATFEIKFLSLRGDKLSNFDFSRHDRPSENSAVDWTKKFVFDKEVSFPPDRPWRCIILTDGKSPPPDWKNDEWKKAARVDAIVMPPQRNVEKSVLSEQWTTFAQNLRGTAVVLALTDLPPADRAPTEEELKRITQDGAIATAVLRGLLDGPYVDDNTPNTTK